MRYLALACDYDGTLARNGRVDAPTIEALRQAAASGRTLILVTGRRLPELLRDFAESDAAVFDAIVCENGASLYRPATKEERSLAPAPPADFVQALRDRGVAPLEVGHSIVATWQPNEQAVLETIKAQGLEWQIIFNKGAVMVLPPGINKASGLSAALTELRLSPHNVVAVGDAENDHALFESAEFSVAVANALPVVKAKADRTTRGDHGAGVRELIAQLLQDDLASWPAPRRQLWLGTTPDQQRVEMPPYSEGAVLICGGSGSGKSTASLGLLERLAQMDYQLCIIDPEGDYDTFEPAFTRGDPKHAPGLDEILHTLRGPDAHASVNLLGVAVNDRPVFFASLLPRLQDLRARTGRPHWIVIDEAHHMLHPSWEHAPATIPQRLESTILITVHPDQLAASLLQTVTIVISVGDQAAEGIQAFCQALNRPAPNVAERPAKGEALVWFVSNEEAPRLVRIEPAKAERRRHLRKYAEGELGEDKSFYFRGPQNRLNLRAQNLMIFTQMAEGVDDATWQHHLRAGDYSKWFRQAIKDPQLADRAQEIERDTTLAAAPSRARMKALIEERYSAPARAPAP